MSELTQLAQQEKKQTYNFNKLQKRLRRNVGNAIADFGMIEDAIKSWCVYPEAKIVIRFSIFC